MTQVNNVVLTIGSHPELPYDFMNPCPDLQISIGNGAKDNQPQQETYTAKDLTELLKEPRVTEETHAEYQQLKVEDKALADEIKSGPYIAPCIFKGGKRRAANAAKYCAVCLDYDEGPVAKIAIEKVKNALPEPLRYWAWTTHSNTPTAGKWRLLIPTNKTVSSREYQFISRTVAAFIGEATGLWPDKSTFDIGRLFYLPSRSKDTKSFSFSTTWGTQPLDVEALLAQNQNPADPTHWPLMPNESSAPAASTWNGEPVDPTSKPGIDGVVNRLDLESTIHEELDCYEPGTKAGYLTYIGGGDSINGTQIIGPYKGFIKNHQDSNPIGNGPAITLYHVLRIHLFGGMDEDDSIKKSCIAMDEYARTVLAEKYEEVREGLKELDELNAVSDTEFDEDDSPFSDPVSKGKKQNLLNGWLDNLVFFQNGASALVINTSLPVTTNVKAPTFETFKKTQAQHYVVNSKGNRTALADVWLGHKERKTVVGEGFYPGDDRIVKKRGYSLINQYASPPHEENPTNDRRLARLYIQHLEYLIPDEKERDWFSAWLGYIIQNPKERLPTCPLHISEQHGTGRGLVSRLLQALIGVDTGAYTAISFNTLVNNGSKGAVYDDHLYRTRFCSVEEVDQKASSKNRFEIGATLREVMSATTKSLNIKSREKANERIYTQFFLQANLSECQIVLPPEDRRITVITGPGELKEQSYYDELYSLLEGDAPRQFYWYLKTLDVSALEKKHNFSVKRSIETQGRNMLVESGISPVDREFNSLLAAVERGDFHPVVTVKIVADYVWAGLENHEQLNTDKIAVDKQVSAILKRYPRPKGYEPKPLKSGKRESKKLHVNKGIVGTSNASIRQLTKPDKQFTPEKLREMVEENCNRVKQLPPLLDL
jgi:hypothetical protein